VPHHLERRGPGADHDAGLQYHGLDAGLDEDLADLGTRGQMSRQLHALGMQAAQVDHPPDPGLLRGVDDVARRLPLLGDEVLRRAHRVHQVVDDVGAVEGCRQRLGIRQIALRNLDAVAPRRVIQLGRGARHRPYGMTSVEQFRHQKATDVAGSAGHQATQLFRGHGLG
jgi:hypothetical protein